MSVMFVCGLREPRRRKSGTAEAVPEQVMADQFGEGAGSLALAVAVDLRHRDARVVVEIDSDPSILRRLGRPYNRICGAAAMRRPCR